MVEYQKIPNLFYFDEIRKIFILNRYSKDEFIWLRDCYWMGSEKIDGTNIGIVWDGDKLSYQGRRVRTEIPHQQKDWLDENFLTYENNCAFEQLFRNKYAVIFGELFGYNIKSIGKKYSEDFSFRAFDVWHDGAYLTQKEAYDICFSLGIGMVPIYARSRTIKEWVDFVKEGHMSDIYTDSDNKNYSEGIVIRPSYDMNLYGNDGERIICKIKFCEIRKGVDG